MVSPMLIPLDQWFQCVLMSPIDKIFNQYLLYDHFCLLFLLCVQRKEGMETIILSKAMQA